MKKNNLTFPVLSDTNNQVAEKFGLVFALPEKLRVIYNSFGVDLERFNGDNSWELPMSGRFIIDSEGVVRNVDVHPDHTVRPEPTEIIDLLKSL